jgi:L-rhamnose-H+ transport protein
MAAHPGVFLTYGGATITVGVAVLLTGVVTYALAGIRKDAKMKANATAANTGATQEKRVKLFKGLAIVMLAGLCDPFLNFAFAFGVRIKQQAIAAGAASGAEADAIWALVVFGSFFVNVIYCTVLLMRKATWARFWGKGTSGHWLLASAMALIWMFSITLYGRGASLMGPLGSSVGWAVFYCCIIIFSTFWGIISGEWREGQGRPLHTLYAGLGVLTVAIVILGYGNTLPTQ